MKKLMFCFLTLLVFLSLSGCSKNTKTTSVTAKTQPVQAVAPAKTDTPVQTQTGSDAVDYTKGPKIVIKIGHVSQAGVPFDVACNKIGEDLDKATNGRITVKVFPASSLGNNTELLEQVQAGTLQMTASSVAFFGTFTDSTKLLDLPYLFKSNKAAEEVLDGEVGQKIFKDFETQDFHGLAWFSTGWRHLTANKPIHSPADMKGLKIRVMENQMHIDHFNALGASAVPMAFSELYTALQNKTMDAEENPFANINGNRLYEVQKYIIKTGHIYDTAPLVASSKWWKTLSKSDQDLIQQICTKELSEERKLSYANEAELEKKIGSNGTNVVIQLSPEERDVFKKAAQPVYDKYAPQIGKDLIDMVEKINAKY